MINYILCFQFIYDSKTSAIPKLMKENHTMNKDLSRIWSNSENSIFVNPRYLILYLFIIREIYITEFICVVYFISIFFILAFSHTNFL